MLENFRLRVYVVASFGALLAERGTLWRVGVRPLVQGVTLWVVIAAASLVAIRLGWIAV